MPTRILPVTPDDPREDRLEAALDALRSGGLVVIPTETFYGFAVDASNPDALRRLNLVKRKPPDSPVLLLAADEEQARASARDLPESFDRLAATFWPGPLTMVVPAAPDLPEEVSGGRGTVGIRVPGIALPRRLARRLGGPLSGVSANLHQQSPIRRASEVLQVFPEGIDIIMDCGPTAGGAPSTVIDLTGDEPCILREGILPSSSLRPFLPGFRP